MGFALSRWLWVSLVFMTVAGFGMMVQMASTNTVIQTIVDEEKRGRVMSFYTMSFLGTAPFGSLLAGWLSTRIGAPQTVLLSGVLCIATAAWFARELPAIRELVRPIYMRMGILPEVAQGLQTAEHESKTKNDKRSKVGVLERDYIRCVVLRFAFLAQLREEFLHIVRQRGFEFHGLLLDRMDEAEAPGVKGLALERNRAQLVGAVGITNFTH